MADHIEDIVEHERKTKRSVIPFAIAVLALIGLWLMFLRYL